MTALIIILVIVALVVIYFISTYNSFVKLRNQAEEANAGIDVHLKQRYDLIPNLVETVKGYAKHEKETLIEVTKMRTGVPQNANMEQLQEVSNNLQALAKQLDVVVERYPELKADTSFVELQRASRDVEENLQAARRMYNSNVSYYNQKREVFPSSIVANHYHLEKALFFEVEEIKRSDVKMDF